MDNFLERVLTAAEKHGQDSEPDMEVGDLQQLARDLWTVLTPEQQTVFASSQILGWEEFIEQWLPEEQNGQSQDLRSRGTESG